ncbi:MAG: deoxyribodipyrimidine photo-lyase [Alphaproteobacteria bacterium]|nr:deoxyribodipyrimidine photo-lyase [Alphaproteobacteria bacterium]
MNLSLVWLRRDLRLHDHVPLSLALQASHPVQPIFIFDTDILARFNNPRDRRLSFIARTLHHMHTQLVKRGGGLLVLHGKPQEIIPKLASVLKADAIYSAEDFEPATIARDAAVKASLTTTRFVQAVDHLIHAPYKILKDDGTPFKVFTPYYKQWQKHLSPADSAEALVNDKKRYADIAKSTTLAKQAGLNIVPMETVAAMLTAIGYSEVEDALWNVDNAQDRLKTFIAQRLKAYGSARDFMATIGTSQLSPYLRFGLVSVRECLRAAQAAGVGEKWISELAWREFYAMILFHWPNVVREEFQAQYRVIGWNQAGALWDAFTRGMTGYPIVDAAVRELLQTGWMHNRARMIVASFLTKDLLIDWRLGEEFFAQHLMDYELASNNGGWQWAASTGTDAAPYFRIFNPVLQSKKFDGAGKYIRHYVPELKSLSDKEIHAPWELGLMAPKSYPAPIVNHAEAKDKAVAVFRALGHKMGG